ncbi:hypothetical protein SAMN04515668_1695 [Hymenobacter arizonensis]|uniref:Roadblock/LC7 domain-containing protein n=2 Tax=Hymenobacter arizonensis TaxID=1227077 RepID=A0A1I5X7T3_HYMAR|nr:hypothetical protein SAMN04515668_1695 [Hymenobacter arizonensis]
MKSGSPKITYDSGINAGQKTQFGALLTNIKRELPELLAVSVVELRSGKLLATHHIPGKLAPGKAAGYNAEVIRQKQQALQVMGLAEEEAIEDILVTLNTQWHILRLLPGNRTFLHLMVNMRDTNLGIAREVVRSQAHAAA